jgi:hypothetical protein
MELQKIVIFIQELALLWARAISAPKSLLQSHFVPDDVLIANGLRFYLIMLAVSMVFYLAIALRHGTEFGAKVRLAANGLTSLLTTALVAAIWHLPFHWFGGKGSFGGTFLAIVYGSSPYSPITSLLAMLMLAGLPEQLRDRAMNPATAGMAIQEAFNDPNTSKGTYVFGCMFTWLGLFISWVVTLNCMAYVHDVHGMKLVLAILLSFVLSMPVGLFIQKILGVLTPSQP